MKKIEVEKMINIQGGIACSQVGDVLNWLYQNDLAQFEALLDIFGPAGGYTLQCN